MVNYAPGDLVFVPDEEKAFCAGKILTIDAAASKAEVDVLRGAPQTLPLSELRLRFEREDGATAQDATSLVFMSDATILENLQKRHAKDEIYTYTASVLLAVNPYKDIRGLYSDDQCARYKGKHIGALPPHPYAIADAAYRALVREKKNQGLLISGESGAGKTETAKIVMHFLAFASGSAGSRADNIQARVLRAQPILESMGNAATMRNSNSSRFGKYNRVFFDEQGALVDAGITTYLLESSRVVTHGDRERNYHCFYELLRGVEEAKLREWNLERDRKYRLLSSCNGQQLEGFETRDRINFKRMCDALRTVGLDEESIDNMLRVLAGLIHLGDLELDEGSSSEESSSSDDGVEVVDDSVQAASKLLGLDEDQLRRRLTHKRVAVPGRTSFHEVARSRSQFRHALQSFIKAIYKRLFDRTVQRINDCFRDQRTPSSPEEAYNHIGILDIYGFENLARNSFEQLCINLANERLQQYFVENVLRAEQELYNREGLPWTGLPLPDAQPVFQAIGQTFKTLDEYSQNLTRGVGNATDKTFCKKVLEEAAKDPLRKEVLKQIKMTGNAARRSTNGPGLDEGFIIKHYAGSVQYNTEGWLDKNNDRLLAECEELICESSDPLVQSLGEEETNGKGPLFRSISKKYSKDLEALLETLSTCNLHYIRCFKPNEEQKPDSFSPRMVLDQLVQCGTIELVKIMHDGYPNRCPFEEITTRFRSLLPESFQRYGMRTFVEALMMAYEVPENQWALGMSRLFLKAGQLHALEEMRSEGSSLSSEKLQEIVRAIVRRRWIRAGHAIRLCNYLPRFMNGIYTRRARNSLSQVATLSSRLLPRLLAARKRVADRHVAVRHRFVRAVHAITLSKDLFRKIQQKRRDHWVAEWQKSVTLIVQAKRWLKRARRTIMEIEHKRELELKREEERLAEAARKAKEAQEQFELDKKRWEEEAAAKLEAAKQEAEAAKKKEEEERKNFLEQERQKMMEEMAEERRKFMAQMEEQRQAMDEERRRQTIRSQASPQRTGSLAMSAGEEARHRVTSPTGTSITETQELDLGDSASVAATSTTKHLEDTVRRMMIEREAKDKELLEKMAKIEEENRTLRQQVEQDRHQRYMPNFTPPQNQNPSPIPLDHQLSFTPEQLEARKSKTSKQPKQRPSMVSSRGSLGCGNRDKDKRRSVTTEALLKGWDRDNMKYSKTKRFHEEQRHFLLEDIYQHDLSSSDSRPTAQQGRNLAAEFNTTEEPELEQGPATRMR